MIDSYRVVAKNLVEIEAMSLAGRKVAPIIEHVASQDALELVEPPQVGLVVFEFTSVQREEAVKPLQSSLGTRRLWLVAGPALISVKARRFGARITEPKIAGFPEDVQHCVPLAAHARGLRPLALRFPSIDVPLVPFHLSAWGDRKAATGEPVFRAFDRRQRIAQQRLGDGSVSTIIKSRVKAYAILNGKSKAEAEQIVRQLSGHSMRAGFATTAADHEVDLARLAKHTRHKSLEVLLGYVRNAEQWKRSPLRGVGF